MRKVVSLLALLLILLYPVFSLQEGKYLLAQADTTKYHTSEEEKLKASCTCIPKTTLEDVRATVLIEKLGRVVASNSLSGKESVSVETYSLLYEPGTYNIYCICEGKKKIDDLTYEYESVVDEKSIMHNSSFKNIHTAAVITNLPIKFPKVCKCVKWGKGCILHEYKLVKKCRKIPTCLEYKTRRFYMENGHYYTMRICTRRGWKYVCKYYKSPICKKYGYRCLKYECNGFASGVTPNSNESYVCMVPIENGKDYELLFEFQGNEAEKFKECLMRNGTFINKKEFSIEPLENEGIQPVLYKIIELNVVSFLHLNSGERRWIGYLPIEEVKNLVSSGKVKAICYLKGKPYCLVRRGNRTYWLTKFNGRWIGIKEFSPEFYDAAWIYTREPVEIEVYDTKINETKITSGYNYVLLPSDNVNELDVKCNDPEGKVYIFSKINGIWVAYSIKERKSYCRHVKWEECDLLPEIKKYLGNIVLYKGKGTCIIKKSENLKEFGIEDMLPDEDLP